jgi:hypothetical protein
MPATDLFLIFIRKLESLRIPHMICGSVASSVYGDPRLTQDVDLVVSLTLEDAPRLAAAFPLDQFYCPPQETLREEIARLRRGHFNLIHHATGFKADLYLCGEDPFQAWGLSKVRQAPFEGELLPVAPPEYVIVKKLEYFQEGGSQKHLRDIHRMLATLGPGWGRSELEDLIRQRGLLEEWKAATEFREVP